MWTPTHAQVTVHRARNLVPKGKGGTNDGYVTIQLGKEKYQTSVKERSENPEWHEECDLRIGSAKEVHLNVFHRSFLGLDDFLGHVALPLEQFQIYERPRSRWHLLKGRPGKKSDTKYRGEIECKITFVVHSKKEGENPEVLRRAGSIKNLANTMTEKLKLPVRSSSFKEKEESSKKKKAFVEPLVRSPTDRLSLPPNSSLGFSGSPQVDHAPFGATEIGTIKESPHEIDPGLTPLHSQNKQLSFSEADLNKRWRNSDVSRRVSPEETDGLIRYKQPLYKTTVLPVTKTTDSTETTVAPCAVTEAPLLRRATSDADAKFVQKGKQDSTADELKPLKDTREMTKSLSKLDEEVEMSLDLDGDTALTDRSRSSVGSSIPESIPEETTSEITDRHNLNRLSLSSFDGTSEDRRHSLQVGAEDIHVPAHSLREVADERRKAASISPELIDEYHGITREELIKLVHTQKNALYSKDMYIRDLESYIDNLLVRVMESTPRILQNPFSTGQTKTDVTLVMTPASDNVVKTAPAKRKSSNPFKLRT